MGHSSAPNVVTVQDVERVAYLARLQLQEPELKRLAAQLDEILRYVQQLQTVPTEGIEPTNHVLALSNVTRPDSPEASVAPEDVLRLAPARHHQFFKVPKGIET